MPTGNFTAGDVFCATDDNSVGRTASTPYGRARLNDADAAAARTALGLGTAATHATGDYDAAGAAATAQSNAIAASAQRASNLSDLANAGTARTNLGLGTMAVKGQIAFVPDSAAPDLATLVANYNALLAAMRASGAMAAS